MTAIRGLMPTSSPPTSPNTRKKARKLEAPIWKRWGRLVGEVEETMDLSLCKVVFRKRLSNRDRGKGPKGKSYVSKDLSGLVAPDRWRSAICRPSWIWNPFQMRHFAHKEETSRSCSVVVAMFDASTWRRSPSSFQENRSPQATFHSFWSTRISTGTHFVLSVLASSESVILELPPLNRCVGSSKGKLLARKSSRMTGYLLGSPRASYRSIRYQSSFWTSEQCQDFEE